MFMEGTDRQSSVAQLFLYCVTVYILVFGVGCVMYSNVVFMEGRDRQVRLW